MNADALKRDFVDKYHSVGEQKFYRFLLVYAINKLIKIRDGEYKGTSPELEYLDYSERFVFLYRREAEEVYLKLAHIFRKAGNKIYRMMLKKGLTKKNSKFLNIV
jgi:hypothetical protein